MSKQAQKEATQDAIKELDERKEMRNLALHNVPVAAFHDMRASQNLMKTQFSEMCTRTNAEGLVLTVRTEWEHYNRPFVLSSSERVEQFFQMTCGRSVTDFARQLEQYCLSGVGAVADNYVADLNKLKGQVTSVINSKLADVARPDNVGRMFYKNFEEHITKRFGLILEGWPLKKFQAPGYINSRPELNVLMNAFSSDAARFRRLTDAEFERWEKDNLPGTFGLHGPWAFDELNAQVSASASEASAGASEPGSSAGPPNLQSPPAEVQPIPHIPIPTPPTAAPESQSFVFRLDGGAAGTTGTTGTAGTTGVEAPKTKKRKARSDKGKKRGPNARSMARAVRPQDPSTSS
ncbi:hypothetical protein EIP86_002544 [Pleurotus ostreatoroseus]|nr:hypothetical protein EIP86_002544 [Pleurotus ostreatoroseus]